MKTVSIVKAGLGGGAALLLAGFVAAPAQASSGASVPCSSAALSAAITAANTAGGGTINLAPGCHYALTSAVSGEDGLPPIVVPISVNGNGATIDGTGVVRVLEVDGPGGNLSAQNLTITGGAADIGGGIENVGGTVTLNHTQVTGNTATLAGGGIASATFDPSSVAKLTLNNSAVTGNSQTESPAAGGLGGGGIVNVLGTVTLNSSQVNGNSAQDFVGGGIASGDYFGFSGTSSFLTLNGSQVDNNTAPNAGGGGIQDLLGTATLNSSQVDGNTSLNGGGISSGNGAGGAAQPGSSHLVLSKSQVDGNTATAPPGPGAPPIAAGGIANGLPMALPGGALTLNHSTVTGNTATHGGGIFNNGGTVTLSKTSITANTPDNCEPAIAGCTG